MKRFSIIALLALVALVSASNELIVGKREKDDQLIAKQEIHCEGLWFWWVKNEYKTFSTNGVDVIPRVELIDLWRDEESAKPQIISGGPGFTDVSIMLESMPGKGIHFLLKVYGKPDHPKYNGGKNSGIDFNAK